MRYFIDFRSSRKRPIEEEEEKEIKTIFEKKMNHLERVKGTSPPKRSSRLAKSPSLRSRAENKNKICYQYAALHLFENFIELMGYNYEDFMQNLNLDLVDEKYMETFKPVYLKLFYDPNEDYYEDISSTKFDEDDDFIIVKSNVKEICENTITLSFYHPNDSTKQLKTIVVDREKNENIFEELLQMGSAYEYLESILDVLSDAGLIDYNIILSKEKFENHENYKIGTLVSVVTRITKRRHVLSVVALSNSEYYLVDNNTKYEFSSFEELLNHINKNYHIKNIQEVFFVEKDMDNTDD